MPTADEIRDRIVAALIQQAFSVKAHSPTSSFAEDKGEPDKGWDTEPDPLSPYDDSPTGDRPGLPSTDIPSGMREYGGPITPAPDAPAMPEGATPAPTMNPSDIPSSNMPSYDPGGLPAAPAQQGASLTDPGMGALGLGDIGALGALGNSSSDSDNTGGSSGVG